MLNLVAVLAISEIVSLTWDLLAVKYPKLPNWPAGEVLAFFAISFAIVQFIDARRQEHELAEIAGEMSTRFVGLFPKNLAEITEVVSKAKHHLYIIADFIGYGVYSDPEGHSRYLRALEEALGGDVGVQIISYNSVLASSESVQQFPDGPKMFAGKLKPRVFNRYFQKYKHVRRPKDNAGLRAILDETEEKCREDLCKKGLKPKYLHETAAFFLWLEDDEEAIFTFKNIGNNERGFSFRTRDANLVGQFSDIFERRWKAASPDYTPSHGTETAQDAILKRD
jgi:hypothetical protein